jgi:hypothetical protein
MCKHTRTNELAYVNEKMLAVQYACSVISPAWILLLPLTRAFCEDRRCRVLHEEVIV